MNRIVAAQVARLITAIGAADALVFTSATGAGATAVGSTVPFAPSSTAWAV
ncbi:hypothetical protein [Streptomyces cyslabdanicus]|uniref:hypothetical protein n=1 Tax=Streptomyces cyslabdanicus TaxID=1470456 RepID=UPI004043BA73